ncbi:MAG: helix-turn-helix transcriptional regulator [Candidatus Krumholzibacteriota bacterium]|nr:helix-turn-helix transcriptional regulator [Candidatus Krumholzibacteriota bacterium]
MSKHFDDGHHPVDCQKWSVGARYEWTLLREEAGLTLRQLGRMLNVDSSSVSRWESGQRWPENRDYFEWLIEAGARAVLDVESEHSEVVHECLVVNGHVDVFFQPVETNVHCLSKVRGHP